MKTTQGGLFSCKGYIGRGEGPMSFVQISPPITVTGTVTEDARQRIAQMLSEGKVFHVSTFELGTGSLTVDPNLTMLPNPIFGPEPIDTSFRQKDNPLNSVFVCRLEHDEAVGSDISNIGLWGEVVYSPEDGDPEVGASFLFAVGTFPSRTKTDSEVLEYRVVLSF